MRYWLYSDGNILGPYDPAEMLASPAFNDDSLVCTETSTGDNAEDWKAASQVSELASMLGSGRSLAGIAARAGQLERSMDSALLGGEEPAASSGGGSYGELLDTIDKLLGTRGAGEDPGKPREVDYDFAEKFDIRLSRIQEELEAARWEKNLLLEKMRIAELEEKKNKTRIAELEARIKGEIRSAGLNAREMEQAQHLSELKEKTEELRKIEEIRKEEQSLQKYLVPEKKEEPGTAAAPQTPPAEAGPKKLKTLGSSGTVELRRTAGDDAAPEPGVSSGKLRSLGQTQEPVYVYGAKPDAQVLKSGPAPEPKPEPVKPQSFDSFRDRPLASPEAAPPGAFRPEIFEPLPQQAGGVVYDFTVVTPKTDSFSQQFQIETRPGTQHVAPAPAPQYAAPAPAPQYIAPAPAPVPQFQVPAPAPAPQFVAPAPAPQFQVPAPAPAAALQTERFPSFNQTPAPTAQPTGISAAAGAVSFSPGAGPSGEKTPAPVSPDKTQRLPVPDDTEAGHQTKAARDQKGKAGQTAMAPVRPSRKGGKAFVAVLAIFSMIAVGGLGYFFMGDGLSFSEFSMMNLGSKKKADAAQDLTDDAQQAPPAQPEAQQPPVQPEAQPAPAQPEPQPVPEQPEAQAPAKTGSESVRKAIEIVKTYKLAAGRGTVESWFANSFLSGGASGANEEWTATPLHGDVLVVQYRLLRPKQEPLTYQFEVDAAKSLIVRGINNNAIELLDSGKEKTVSAAPVKKPAKKVPAVKKPSRPKEIGLLPLPDAPEASPASEPDPTGFEAPEDDEKVKYLKAQESDEELF